MIVAGEVTVQLEKAVLKSSFSRLGGLQLDREVNWLNNHKQKKQKDKEAKSEMSCVQMEWKLFVLVLQLSVLICS